MEIVPRKWEEPRGAIRRGEIRGGEIRRGESTGEARKRTGDALDGWCDGTPISRIVLRGAYTGVRRLIFAVTVL